MWTAAVLNCSLSSFSNTPCPGWQTNHSTVVCYQISTLSSRHDSKSSIRSRKEGTLQKIGEFLQSSPTLLGTKGQFPAQRLLILNLSERDREKSSPMFLCRISICQKYREVKTPTAPLLATNHIYLSQCVKMHRNNFLTKDKPEEIKSFWT